MTRAHRGRQNMYETPYHNQIVYGTLHHNTSAGHWSTAVGESNRSNERARTQTTRTKQCHPTLSRVRVQQRSTHVNELC